MMTSMKLKILFSGVILFVTAMTFAIAESQMARPTQEGSMMKTEEEAKAPKDTTIRVPELDYRREWVALGSWAVASDEEDIAGSKEFHVVYTQPETVDAYRKTGTFPDGAVILKELFAADTEEMTTGTVSRAGKPTGWFVMVKDTKGRHPESKLWGDGWGWAFFNADDPKQTVSTDYEADCVGCHTPAKDRDWIFTEGYPILKR